MEKMRKKLVYAVIASESIHIFCCVLPTVFSAASLLVGMGMITAIPGFVTETHHMIHDYEVPMIIMSAIILIVGWMLYLSSIKMNCSAENSTCCHEPCAPKKDRTRIVMIIATILFVLNITVYFGFHRENNIEIHNDKTQEQSHQDHHH